MVWRSSGALAALVLAVPVAASAQSGPAESGPAQPTLEQRVQRLEDVAAIQRVLVEYSARIDARDFAGYAALFAQDGTWQNGTTVRRGREEIQAMLVGLFGTPEAGFVNAEDYHLVSNPQVDVQGDRATARSRHLLVMRGENGQPQPMLAGLYEDELIREDGGWKILRRVDNPVMPTADEWLKIIAERNAR
jgi:uncharacterized protein (TIGR02246 family)